MNLFRGFGYGIFLAAPLLVACSQTSRPSSSKIVRSPIEAPEAGQPKEPVNQDSSNEASAGSQPEKDGNATIQNPPAAMGPVTAGPPQPATGSVAITLNIVPPTPAGPYRNRGHIRSVWITDANDGYIKTVHAFAGQRSVHLKRWNVFTGNVLDGTTGATQTTPAAGIPISTTWDLKNKAGALMNTGNYKLWLEFTEANTPALDQGKKPSDPMQAIDNVNGYEYLAIPFTVSPQGTTKTDSANAVFKDVLIKHVP